MRQPFGLTQQRRSLSLCNTSLAKTIVGAHAHRLFLGKSPRPLEKPALRTAETISLVSHQVSVSGLNHILKKTSKKRSINEFPTQ
jgi:hypothetical protein